MTGVILRSLNLLNFYFQEEVERSQCMVVAVKCVTSMLLQSTLTPIPGNPSNSVYEMRPRDKPLGFLHTRYFEDVIFFCFNTSKNFDIQKKYVLNRFRVMLMQIIYCISVCIIHINVSYALHFLKVKTYLKKFF